MLRKKWLIFISLFLSGAAAGAAVALPFCPSSLTGQARIWATLGQGFIVLLAIAIPVGYLILMAVGAMQVTRPAQGTPAEHPTGWIHPGHRIDRVLVTAGGGINARFAIELAARIADDDEGQVTLLRVLSPDQADRCEPLCDELTGIAAEVLGTEYPVNVITPISDSVVDAVLQEASQGYDLLVVGASEQRPLRNWLFGALPDMIARQSPCPVLVVRGGPVVRKV
ncbi:MAG: universal stress protein [Anaerolineae bacterium]